MEQQNNVITPAWGKKMKGEVPGVGTCRDGVSEFSRGAKLKAGRPPEVMHPPNFFFPMITAESKATLKHPDTERKD